MVPSHFNSYCEQSHKVLLFSLHFSLLLPSFSKIQLSYQNTFFLSLSKFCDFPCIICHPMLYKFNHFLITSKHVKTMFYTLQGILLYDIIHSHILIFLKCIRGRLRGHIRPTYRYGKHKFNSIP